MPITPETNPLLSDLSQPPGVQDPRQTALIAMFIKAQEAFKGIAGAEVSPEVKQKALMSGLSGQPSGGDEQGLKDLGATLTGGTAGIPSDLINMLVEGFIASESLKSGADVDPADVPKLPGGSDENIEALGGDPDSPVRTTADLLSMMLQPENAAKLIPMALGTIKKVKGTGNVLDTSKRFRDKSFNDKKTGDGGLDGFLDTLKDGKPFTKEEEIANLTKIVEGTIKDYPPELQMVARERLIKLGASDVPTVKVIGQRIEVLKEQGLTTDEIKILQENDPTLEGSMKEIFTDGGNPRELARKAINKQVDRGDVIHTADGPARIIPFPDIGVPLDEATIKNALPGLKRNLDTATGPQLEHTKELIDRYEKALVSGIDPNTPITEVPKPLSSENADKMRERISSIQEKVVTKEQDLHLKKGQVADVEDQASSAALVQEDKMSKRIAEGKRIKAAAPTEADGHMLEFEFLAREEAMDEIEALGASRDKLETFSSEFLEDLADDLNPPIKPSAGDLMRQEKALKRLERWNRTAKSRAEKKIDLNLDRSSTDPKRARELRAEPKSGIGGEELAVNRFSFAGQQHTAEGRNLLRQMTDSEFKWTIEHSGFKERTKSFLKQQRETPMEPDLRSDFDKQVKEHAKKELEEKMNITRMEKPTLGDSTRRLNRATEALNKDKAISTEGIVVDENPKEISLEVRRQLRERQRRNEQARETTRLGDTPLVKDPKGKKKKRSKRSREDDINLIASVGDAQRGLPEQVMLKAQHQMGGGVLSHALEHVGDLTHRMSEVTKFGRGSIDLVQDKVTKQLSNLKNGYGFEREFLENMQSNASFRNRDLTEFTAETDKLLKEYADAHRAIKVYNEPQRWARDAAVALGEKNFPKAIENLEKLDAAMKDPDEFLKRISEITE